MVKVHLVCVNTRSQTSVVLTVSVVVFEDHSAGVCVILIRSQTGGQVVA